jgi:hypothetical protein
VKNKLLVFGVIAGMFGAAAGIHYRIPIVIAAVAIGLALFSAVTGVRMIVTRKAEVPTGGGIRPYHEYHTGISAQFWGVLFLLFSVPIAAFGIGYWLYGGDPPATILTGMLKSPVMSGLMIITAGVGLLLYGLTRLIPGKAAFAELGIKHFELKMSGWWWCLVGTTIALAGCVRAVAPGTLTRMRDSAIDWVLAMVR